MVGSSVLYLLNQYTMLNIISMPAVAVDGAMLASRDFGFMLFTGFISLLIQWKLLASSWCSSVSAVFATFTFRLGAYALLALLRVAWGYGPLGKALRRRTGNGTDDINGANVRLSGNL